MPDACPLAHVLVVATIELRHPVALIIQVKTHDVTRKAFHIAKVKQNDSLPDCRF